MFNPIAYIREVLEFVKNPAGEAVAARLVVEEDLALINETWPKNSTMHKPAAGDYMMVFSRTENPIICKPSDFAKHYHLTEFVFLTDEEDRPNWYRVETFNPI